HHLTELPRDLDLVLKEIRRILVEGGLLVVVEPWNTLFLRCVHAATRSRCWPTLYPRLRTLATLIEGEKTTYFAWLAQPAVILALLRGAFTVRT
ncbi:hypothetical protein, partial [Glaesserella parasuis]|uniref:hypothetical protein n=1 Tax=Glaesserella parasuis TaxID=738 RepID=UPI003F2F66AC